MKNYTSLALILLVGVGLQAQEKSLDALKQKRQQAEKAIANRFPTTRLLDVQYEQFEKTDYTSKLYGNNYESGTVKEQQRIKVAANIPLIKKDRWILSSSFRYNFESISFENVVVPSGGTPVLAQKENLDSHYLSGSLNYTRYDKLFGKAYVSNISVFVDGSEEEFGQFNEMYLGSFVLVKNERTLLTAGFILQSNPNGVFPVLPTFSYNHKFENSPWEIDIALPKQVYFRRQLLKNGRLSLGTELEGSPFYFNSGFRGSEKTYNYNRNDIKTGLMYEYKIDKYFIASFRTGWNSSLNGTIREVNETKDIVKTKFDPNFYFNLGFSFNIAE